MRLRAWLILFGFIFMLSACGNGKVYQEYTDFNSRYWLVSDTAKFRFSIEDTSSRYNVYCNLRNSTQYPYSRIFLNFSLSDSTRKEFHTALLNDFLFDPKSGEPLGKTGLGDLYDHQLAVLKNYKFTKSGPFVVNIEQFMRTDTLQGILSVGVGIEKVSEN
jgi:gliding motility-associated lipoprotein GldH